MKWVAPLVPNPVDEIVAYLVLFGFMGPIVVYLAPLRHLVWPPPAGVLVRWREWKF